MRLDDPRPRPGETEEQRQQRLVKAAKYTKLVTESRSLANRSALAGRMIRLIFLAVIGVVITGVGIRDWSDPRQTASTEGFVNRHFGPHGNAIYITALGLLIIGLNLYFLIRYLRRVRSLPPLNAPKS